MGIYEWLKNKYRGEEESGSSESKSDVDTGDFLKGKYLEELSFDEYVVLIDSYCDDSETLGLMADAISLNTKLSPEDKNELWDRIDKEQTRDKKEG